MASVVGLSLFIWSIRAIRCPKNGVWIDLKLRTVLRVDSQSRRSVPFESLGKLVVSSSTYRARVGNGGSNDMTTLTSHAVLAPESFGDKELFSGGDESEVEAWAETLRSLLRAPTIDTITYEEAEMSAAEGSFGASRETVLWRAAPFAVDGHLSAHALQAANASYIRQRGSFLGRVLASRIAGAFLCALFLGTGGRIVFALYNSPLERRQELVIAAAVCLFFGVLWLRAIRLWPVAIAAALASGAALVGKPIFDLNSSNHRGEVHVFELTSEVHFYFLVSGAALIATALVIGIGRLWAWFVSRGH